MVLFRRAVGVLSGLQNNQTSTGHYRLLKVKVKFTLEQATKAQMGSSGVALFFL